MARCGVSARRRPSGGGPSMALRLAVCDFHHCLHLPSRVRVLGLAWATFPGATTQPRVRGRSASGRLSSLESLSIRLLLAGRTYLAAAFPSCDAGGAFERNKLSHRAPRMREHRVGTSPPESAGTDGRNVASWMAGRTAPRRLCGSWPSSGSTMLASPVHYV